MPMKFTIYRLYLLWAIPLILSNCNSGTREFETGKYDSFSVGESGITSDFTYDGYTQNDTFYLRHLNWRRPSVKESDCGNDTSYYTYFLHAIPIKSKYRTGTLTQEGVWCNKNQIQRNNWTTSTSFRIKNNGEIEITTPDFRPPLNYIIKKRK